MKESYLFDMQFNNVVFASRNKEYGAYELRRDYSRHVLTAALLATTLFVSALAWPLVMPEKQIENQAPVDKDDKGIIYLGPDILPPPIEDPKPKVEQVTPVENKVKAIQHTPPKVVEDNHAGPEETTPTIKEMEGAIIGTQNIDGELTAQQNLEGIETGSTTPGSSTDSGENAIFDHVADMPYFEGGENGLMRHISKKMRYPRKAVQEQVEGIVVVTFVVDRYGKVTDANVIKGLGYGTDEEALRVINSLPNWTPGKQNGKPVAVRYTLPIRFNLQR
ncbi:energy transducer TonB [uncultured Pontibacter sp.]|uniref:energy transducer TonB n=1 Tax=uncultured Pontibacter sp. TaxID=453356 RepID=UPI00260740ED|nr:energy transducer TonB [uncultured Pontibacter sp.]